MTERPLTKVLCCTLMRCASSRCVRESGLREPSQQRTREIFLWCFQKPTKTAELAWVTRSGSKWIEETLARSERGERPAKPPVFSRAEPKPTDTARPAAYAVADRLWKTLYDRWKEENDERIRSHQKKQAVGHFNVKTTKTN